ncbi:MAG: rhomboid family intramembrane serine protease [Phycisphaerae bacterium]|nr:rhomboid family intramembrane serine protease [Phycisphaerae bacterium]
MRCPNCSHYLRQLKVPRSGITVDYCPGCRGTLYNSGEISFIVNDLAIDNRVKPQEIKYFQPRETINIYKTNEKKRLCPKCKIEMKKFNYGTDSNVLLDKCSDCRRIWADKGETLAIASYLKYNPKAERIAKALLDLDKTAEVPDIELPFFLPRVIVPFCDDAPRYTFPFITIAIAVLSTLIFAHQFFDSSHQLSDVMSENIFTFDLFGSMFAQGGILFFLWNMLFLWLFGDNIEDCFGHVGFLIFFLIAMFVGALLHNIITDDVQITAVGIPAAVSAVMGSYFIFFPTANIRIFAVWDCIDIPAAVCLGGWFIFQIVYSIVSADTIDKAAVIIQIILFLCGAALAAVVKSNRKISPNG